MPGLFGINPLVIVGLNGQVAINLDETGPLGDCFSIAILVIGADIRTPALESALPHLRDSIQLNFPALLEVRKASVTAIDPDLTFGIITGHVERPNQIRNLMLLFRLMRQLLDLSGCQSLVIDQLHGDLRCFGANPGV